MTASLCGHSLPSDNETRLCGRHGEPGVPLPLGTDPPYPAEDFSLEDNLADLEQMRSEHVAGTRYVYTVMASDETEVLGCTYYFRTMTECGVPQR